MTDEKRTLQYPSMAPRQDEAPAAAKPGQLAYPSPEMREVRREWKDPLQKDPFTYSTMPKEKPPESLPGAENKPAEGDGQPADEKPGQAEKADAGALSETDREMDQVFTDLVKHGSHEALAEVIGYVREDLTEFAKMDGADEAALQKDLALVDELAAFISRTPDPRWKAWAAGMANEIRKTKKQLAKRR